MGAATLNIEIEQGASFYRLLTVKDNSGTPIDLTGYTFRGQVRSKYSDASILAAFTFTILNQVSATGQVEMTMTDIVTAGIPVASVSDNSRPSTPGIYDVEMVSGSGTVTRLLEGSADISPEVTR